MSAEEQETLTALPHNRPPLVALAVGAGDVTES